MHPRRLAALTIALAITAVYAPRPAAQSRACEIRPNNTAEKLLACVTLKGVRAHQSALQAIADANNGHRTGGSAGDDASADYAQAVLERAGYTVTRQTFQFQTFYQRTPSLLEQIAPAPAGPVANTILSYSGSGDVTAAVVAPSGVNGCQAADFAGFPVGSIALISRGACTFAIKGINAFNAGAAGVVMYNNQPGAIYGTLGNTFSLDIPFTSVTQAVGLQLASTSGLVMRLRVDTFRGLATTTNVLAETNAGDPSSVVMVGAHLDSVNAGPGINDNGSGVAAVLETARMLARTPLQNRVRFALWGAEESGLIGSRFYLNSLSAEERGTIASYLNFDMIGSPNHVFFIHDGDDSDQVGFGPGPDGSDEIEKIFEGFYQSRGLPFKGADFNGRSDYAPFIDYGIPSGGVLTGAEGIKTAAEAAMWGGTAGAAYDPCYHQACDTFDNVNLTALEVNADAVAFATLQLAGPRGARPRARGPSHVVLPPQAQADEHSPVFQ
ncbi:amidohydrolase [Luteitalea sp. TBR-22]|uniref:M28 family metallopeptidase n=1 Tax=Luteitalea sp. TBR-22 TaxID=2802971 RepID=UPI001AF872B4|nr:M28 family metallopeptidase [Luteitalea sp. TBR-22]BCS35126.1 amidohydrolase [Luteitalea sp. TBR-22]